MTVLNFTSLESSGSSLDIEADLYVTDLRARCIAPTDAGAAISTTPILTTRQEDASARDIEIDVASDAGFSTIVWSTTLSAVAPLTNVQATVGVTLTAGTTYWWRVRAVDTGGPTYGPYESRSFKVILPVNAAGYEPVLLNVGVLLEQTRDDYESVLTNVGVDLQPYWGETDYVLANLGVDLTMTKDAYEYAHVGDVDDSNPTPHIWFCEPSSGRPLDGIRIIGSGFGPLESTYSGIVEVDLADGDGWNTIGIVTWQRFPADPDMYGPNREISRTKIDPEHEEIEIVIPVDALPPVMNVRVVLDP
jgi:hypothetical protein